MTSEEEKTTVHIPAQQLAQRLRVMIRERELKPGERLGAERDLAARLEVTRYDLRTALAILERSHEISRKIGRGGGIVVSDNRLERNINTLESLPVIARRQGLEITSKVIQASITPASPSDIRLLSLREPNPTVYEIVRLRYLNGTPLSIETNHLPVLLFPDLLSRDLTTPFYGIFERFYDVHPMNVDETLESVLASPEESQLLGVTNATPLIQIQRVALDQAARPFERAIEIFLADRIRFTMHHSGYVRLSAMKG
ncbi:GntR family transcriptional regulator [Bifidobacterium goeldii]|uniref:GntR family transcriptional regulator n=1 Tax=Bifidobacterium goeldii TaxID=2306975 RepID=A0A430FJ34_9BIFI|nr:GntR family transcriptional regulator [Bifidobacterium goeldii]RSX52810.1 GntR family transcriptional regulator [Bifidobacterium goeldii]